MLTAKKKITKSIKKKFTMFRPRIYSRHPTHSILRTELSLLPFRSCVRLGSTTVINDTVDNGGDRVECNSIQAIKNSSNKRLMKNHFTRNEVKTAEWFQYDSANLFINESNNRTVTSLNELPYPIIAKSLFGSRGEGNTKLNTQAELTSWMRGKDLSNYIFESFYTYLREYRLHITEEGCFYTCRKMLKRDAPEANKWQRHDDNCVWILEDNASFDKPVNWNTIVEHSVKALKAVGLDVGAVDVKVQSATKNNGTRRENPEFIIIEINSAPSFGDLTAEKYINEIPKILRRNYGK